MVIETARLLLRSPDEVNGAQVCRYYVKNREFLEQFEPARGEEFYTERYQRWMVELQCEGWKRKMEYRFYIMEKEKPYEVIGSIALSNVVTGAFWSCFLGYKLDQEHGGRGYMTEAVKAVVEYGFETLKLHRIEANIMPRNAASIAVVTKCGFEYEGTARKYLKINGVWEDHAHYVVLNEAVE